MLTAANPCPCGLSHPVKYGAGVWARLMVRIAATFIGLLLASAAMADHRPSHTVCDRAKLAGRGFVECLESALRESDQTVVQALERARDRIDARSDLIPTQRTRWKNLLDEAHGLFVRFRNFECQNVTPYEGAGGRIGAFEERLACLVDKNMNRAQELRTRYGP
jgi:uncharacterized protein YecT (DUF1311 family)